VTGVEPPANLAHRLAQIGAGLARQKELLLDSLAAVRPA
jgi:hypothetical protein